MNNKKSLFYCLRCFFILKFKVRASKKGGMSFLKGGLTDIPLEECDTGPNLSLFGQDFSLAMVLADFLGIRAFNQEV